MTPCQRPILTPLKLKKISFSVLYSPALFLKMDYMDYYYKYEMGTLVSKIFKTMRRVIYR